MAQLMPLPLTVSCFSKIQIGFTFLVPAHQGSPGQRAVKRVCVCACGQVIMATNRIETLDPALIRPGRIDRKIEFPLPDEKTKRRIFSIHTNRMTLAEDVSLEDYVMAKDDLSGADIKVCALLLSSLVAEWLACWTQAQKAWIQIAAATLSGNSLRQTVHIHRASVHQAAKLLAAS